MKNIFDYKIPEQGELFRELLNHKNIKINEIISSDILEDKVYIQNEDEWVVLLEGSAILEMEDREIYLKRGDFLFIPRKTPHRVIKTERGTLWLAMHIW